MAGTLFALEIENFKSFKDKHYIGPFKQFSAIIGPNGSGKSNLMDAISFVLGEKSLNLRVKRLGDLIHGASISLATSTTCRVSMFYKYNEDETKRFTRSVISSSTSEFRINGDVVSPVQYHHALEEIQIFYKAKNFLVYQGQVEQVAMQNPKELTQLFEELSKSADLQAEYDRLKNEMQVAESAVQSFMSKRRDVAIEKKEAKQEKEEARKFQTMKTDLAEKNCELFLVQLYFVEKDKEQIEKQLATIKKRLEEIRDAKMGFEKNVAERQKLSKKFQREKLELERRLAKEDRTLLNKKPEYKKLNQEISHIKIKIDTAEKACKIAQKTADDYQKNVQEIEKKIKEIQSQKQKLEVELTKESQKLQLNLNKEQVAEYRRLKAEVEKRSTIISGNLDHKMQEQAASKSSIEYDKNRLEACTEKIRQRENEIEREKRNLNHLKESEQAKIRFINEEKSALKELEKEVIVSKDRLSKVNDELQAVNKEINDAHGESFESEKVRRQNEALENLKRVFPERVYGRLVDLCQPSQRRYQVSITKVLGKFMNAIVCDTDDTARECIMYLREQHFSPETFLPLSTLEVTPINEKLRDITEIPNVRLVHDVITLNASQARKALQFVCGNSLVCETADNARQLAFGTANRTDRFRAVALDGTQFQPNGVISGGGHDLKARARKWDENTIRKLKDKRAVLQEELQNLQRTRKRELDVEMKRNQLGQLETRLKFTQNEIKKIENQVIRKLEQTLESEQYEPEQSRERIKMREEEMVERQKEIEQLETEKNKIADEIFAQFCATVGIKHIREYEQREIRIHEENEAKINTYKHDEERLQYELDFLKSEDRQSNIIREKEKIKTFTNELDALQKSLRTETNILKELEGVVEQLKEQIEAKRKECEEADQSVAEAKEEGKTVDKELHSLEKQLIQQEQAKNRRMQKRHTLLQQCKLQSIAIPIRNGNLEQINLVDADESQPLSQSSQSQSLIAAEEIEVDYASLKYTRALTNESEVNKIVENLTKTVSEIEATLSKMTVPDSHVDKRMETVKEKEAETTEEYEQARKQAKTARQAFEKVKADRLNRFQRFFEPVSNRIDEIYKLLSQNDGAQAFLGPMNFEEPYLDGIAYNCIAPGKRFRPMDNLSGGEKTIAALALLFALHSSNPSPFFVLDEIDAALDNTNIAKVVHYIGERSRKDIQIIVISLKEEMYNKADALVGVYPKSTTPCIASGILTLDLESFGNIFPAS